MASQADHELPRARIDRQFGQFPGLPARARDPSRASSSCINNIPNVIQAVLKLVTESEEGLNIDNMVNKSRGAYAVTVLDFGPRAERRARFEDRDAASPHTACGCSRRGGSMIGHFRAPGFSSGTILLPAPYVDLAKWAVIACDQFTSQPEILARGGGNRGGKSLRASSDPFLKSTSRRATRVRRAIRNAMAEYRERKGARSRGRGRVHPRGSPGRPPGADSGFWA